MRRGLPATCATAAAALLIGFGAAPAQAASVATGRTLFQSHCAVCHGTNGAGGKHIGSAVSADLQAPGLEKTYHHKTKLIVRAILDGKDQNGQKLNAVMPRWKGQLSKAQARDIVAYLKTLKS